jgi:FkbM family methyltransferase
VLRKFVRTAAKQMGLELHRYIPVHSQAAQLQAMLAFHGVDLVLDVGANTGQFGRELRKHIGYAGRIVSFEPTVAAHRELVSNAKGDPLWEIVERCAIGATEGVIDINVSANSVSSSVLPMLDSHVSAAPDSNYTSVEKVPLHPLDSLAPKWLRESRSALLKIDTQGFEAEVLKGAEQTLLRVQGLQLELSLVPLYSGQVLMPELMAEIAALGFELWASYPAFCDARSGRLLQVDATFFRTAGRQAASDTT